MAKSQREERLDTNGAADNAASNDSGTSADGAEETPRKATRARRTTKKAPEETPATTKAPEESPAAEQAPDAEAPKRPRRRTRAASAEEAPAETAEKPAEEPPKRRRSRAKAPASPAASSDDAPAQAPPAAEAPRDQERRPEQQPEQEEQREPPQERQQQQQQQQRRQGDSGQQNGRGDGSGEGRNRRKRDKRKRKGKSEGNAGGGGGHPGKPFVGMLEMIGDKNFGFIREVHPSLPKGDNDAFMPPPLIEKYNIRDGAILEGTIKPGRKGAWQVSDITKVMGVEPDEWKEFPSFDEGTTIYPNEKLNLVTGPADITMRVVDLVAPLGKGQRALIVAPPRAGKTIILKQLARSMAQNHPEVKLVALLIDERPEEVTDFKRNTEAMVFASSNDYQEDNHIRVATLAFEHCRRMVEMGKDVVLLLDSLTRLGRTFNLWGGNSGRTMSGGLDARALVMPRKIFGAARNIEHGGSLTIVATALIETGSRMDDVIFEEFKGTGNSEIVLDRELAEKRLFPAINLRKSGTRNVEQLMGVEMLQYHHMLMRALNSRHPVEAMQALLRHIQSSPDNIHLLNELIPTDI